MELKSRLKKNENWMIVVLVILILEIFAGVKYDYYYDLNDDVQMKDILAGIGDKKDIVATATEFLQALTKWVTEFINTVKEFFERLKGAKL